MGRSPQMMNYIMNQNQNPAMPNSPIATGAIQGMRAANHSVGISEEQRRRAEGMAMSNFFAAISRPGGAGKIGDMANAINPALATYLGAVNQAELMNERRQEREYEHQRMLQKEQQHAREFAEKMAIERAHLGIQRQKALREEFQSNAVNNLRAAGKIGEDEEPAQFMGLQERRDARKDVIGRIDSSNSSLPVIKGFKKMKELSKKYPNMSEDFARVWAIDPDAEPKAFDQFLSNFVDRDKRTALQQMNKIKSEIVAKQVKTFKGTVPTDLFKMLLKQAVPNFGMTSEALNSVADEAIKQYTEVYDDGVAAKKAWGKGLYKLKSIPSLEEQNPAQSALPENQANEPINNAVQQWKAANPEHADAPDEFIIRYLQEQGNT